LGIVGCGKIGSSMARMAGAGFRVRMLGYDPCKSREQLAAAGIEKCAALQAMLADHQGSTGHHSFQRSAPAIEGVIRMIKAELGRRIYQVSNIKGVFTLHSGQTATEYFDKYLFESDPLLLMEIAKHMRRLLPVEFDLLAGLEMGGIPIATALSLKTGHSTLFVRKEAKIYGTCKLAEGGEIDGRELVIIEDVVTSGGAIIDAARELRSRGAIIKQVCCVIDRESGGRKMLERENLIFRPLFTKSELEKLSI
jgi:orotate phosphoribosyltransferase